MMSTCRGSDAFSGTSSKSPLRRLLMSDLFKRLKPRERSGSKPRCHRLTHGAATQVSARLTALAGPFGRVLPPDHWMPQGFDDLEEAQLDKAPRLLDIRVGKQLRVW